MLNKKIIILIAAIFLAIMATLVSYYYNLKYKVAVVTPSVKTDINSTLVAEKQDIVACEKLDDLMLEKTCLEGVIELNYEKVNCESLSQPELINFCLSEKFGRLARKNNDATLCEKIPDGIKKANCLSEIKKIDLHSDADKDGLDFLQEIINGTDPNNPDTNNNGINDAEEIKLKINIQSSGKNIVRCGEVNDKRLAGICLSELGYNGLGFFNLSECYKIKNLDLKEFCFNKLQSVIESQLK